MNITIKPQFLSGKITPPPSKSQAHRAVMAAALAGNSTLGNLSASDDINATLACMEILKNCKDGLPKLDCGESGSTLRFLIPVALAMCGGGIFTGRGRLMARPQKPYFDIFDQKGIEYSYEGDFLTVKGKLPSGRYELPGDVSSQFVTGLMYALPMVEGDSEIVVTTPLESVGYVDLTLEVIRSFGIEITQNGQIYSIKGGQKFKSHSMDIESDYSQSAFFFAAKALGSDLEIEGLNPNSAQGDRCIIPYTEALCGDGLVELDVSQCPDLVPALAVIASLRDGKETRLVNGARLRIKESDRLETTATELNKLGAKIEELPDSLTIHGVSGFNGGVVSGRNDHRIAMMLAVAATRACAEVTIEGAECVNKSYPNFWEDYCSLGGVHLD